MKHIINEEALTFYTDGSSIPNPRRGGIGILFVYYFDNEEIVDDDFAFTGYKEATNNQMELLAVVKAFDAYQTHTFRKNFSKIDVVTDSKYFYDHIYYAKFIWPRQKWFNKSGKPIENVELWKDLTKRITKVYPIKVEFCWVKGHAKDSFNKKVDRLAKISAKNAFNEPLYQIGLRKKTFTSSTVAGCVKMCGQRLAIRIVTASYLKKQNLNKYRYEVVSKGSQYYGLMDLIYSELFLKEVHYYRVSVNNNQNNPRVLNVIEEIKA